MAKSKAQPKPRILDLYSEARAAAVEAAPKSPSSQSGQKATTTKKES